jgi:hypothetical protein
VSRWKSPQTAAKLAHRDAMQADAIRKDRRNMLLKLAAILALMITVAVADFIWLQSRMRRRIKQRHPEATKTMNGSIEQTNQQTR